MKRQLRLSKGCSTLASLLMVNFAVAQNWMPTSAPTTNWQALACSADGKKLAGAVGYSGLIYISADSGTNWTPSSAPATNWQDIAASADGGKLVAVASGFPWRADLHFS